jgi:hypothetical protein
MNYARVACIRTDRRVERKTGKTVPTDQKNGLRWMKNCFPEHILAVVK